MHALFCAGMNTYRNMSVKAYNDSNFTERGIVYFESVIGRCIVILLIKILRLRNMNHL